MHRGCFAHFLSSSSPMFWDRHKTVSLSAAARCVCAREGKDCWGQPATAITTDRRLCVGSRIQIHPLLMLDQPLVDLEMFKKFIESEIIGY